MLYERGDYDIRLEAAVAKMYNIVAGPTSILRTSIVAVVSDECRSRDST
ncbi:hypothetical protein BH23GEM2_BH23GEM2_18400 [soil metagenome]